MARSSRIGQATPSPGWVSQPADLLGQRRHWIWLLAPLLLIGCTSSSSTPELSAESLIVGHPCGVTLAASDPAQTVGLTLLLTDHDAATSGDVPRTSTVEGGTWEGFLFLGTDVFAGWCHDDDDGRPVIDEVLPVLSGTVEIVGKRRLDAACTVLEAEISELRFERGGEVATLDPLRVTNTAWGCTAEEVRRSAGPPPSGILGALLLAAGALALLSAIPVGYLVGIVLHRLIYVLLGLVLGSPAIELGFGDPEITIGWGRRQRRVPVGARWWTAGSFRAGREVRRPTSRWRELVMAMTSNGVVAGVAGFLLWLAWRGFRSTMPWDQLVDLGDAYPLLYAYYALGIALMMLALVVQRVQPRTSIYGARTAWAVTGSERFYVEGQERAEAMDAWRRRVRAPYLLLRRAKKGDDLGVLEACEDYFTGQPPDRGTRWLDSLTRNDALFFGVQTRALIQLGRYEEALASHQRWAELAKVKPRHRWSADNTRAYILALLGVDLDVAEGCARHAYAAKPTAAVAGTLGAVLVQGDDPSLGVELLLEALEVAVRPADRFETHRFLAIGYQRLNQTDVSLAHQAQARREHPPFAPRLDHLP